MQLAFRDERRGMDLFSLAAGHLRIILTDNDDLRFRNFSAQNGRGLKPVHAGHVDIHQNQIGSKGPRFFESLQTIFGFAYDFDVVPGGKKRP